MLKVRVRNFQSILDASITIDGFTVLTGTNNAGKTALFRALRGVFTNTRGSDFVRYGCGHCTVDVENEEGKKIKWEKGPDGTNTYVIDGKRFDRVGFGVPQEVKDWGVVPVTVNKIDYWPQVAPATKVGFLIDEPGSVLAEAIADVERMNQLGGALKACESERRSVRSERKVREKDRSILLEKKEKFSGLDEVLGNIQEVTRKWERSEQTRRAMQQLLSLRQRLHKAREAVGLFQSLGKVEALIPSQQRVDAAKETRRETIESLDLRGRFQQLKEVLLGLDGIDKIAPPTKNDFQTMGENLRGYEDLVRLGKRVRKVRDGQMGGIPTVVFDTAKVDRARKFIQVLNLTRNLRKRYSEASRSRLEIGNRVRELGGELESIQATMSNVDCPTCGKPMGEVV